MEHKEYVKNLWQDIDQQNWKNISAYFEPSAVIEWANTKERFTVPEFVNANAEYPGDWKITVKRLEEAQNTVISVVLVQLAGEETAFTAVSFFEFENDRISGLTEYWGDVAEPPAWRKNKNL